MKLTRFKVEGGKLQVKEPGDAATSENLQPATCNLQLLPC